MDYISTSEFCSLSGVEYDAVVKRIQRKSIKFKEEETDGRGGKGGKRYLIPITELTPAQQAKYFQMKAASMSDGETVETVLTAQQFKQIELKNVFCRLGIHLEMTGNQMVVLLGKQIMNLWNGGTVKMHRWAKGFAQGGEEALIDGRGKNKSKKVSIRPLISFKASI